MYIKTEVGIIDGNYILRGIPNDVCSTLKRYNAFLAGGSLLSLAFNIGVVKDYDFYFQTEEDFNAVSVYLETDCKYTLVANTHNALTFSNFVQDRQTIPIQLIKVILGEPEEILNSFDINVCKIGFSLRDKLLFYDNSIQKSIEEHTMKLEHFNRPISSVFRVCKYLNKGLKPDYMDMLRLSIVISSLSEEDVESEYGDKGYFSPYHETMEQAYKAFPNILTASTLDHYNLADVMNSKRVLNKIMEKLLSVAI